MVAQEFEHAISYKLSVVRRYPNQHHAACGLSAAIGQIAEILVFSQQNTTFRRRTSQYPPVIQAWIGFRDVGEVNSLGLETRNQGGVAALVKQLRWKAVGHP